MNGNARKTLMYRGSRKHVLDWIEQPSFLPELLLLAEPASPRVSSKSRWMPRSYRQPDEAQLETFGPVCLPDNPLWDMPNVTLTPHIASVSSGNDRRASEIFFENLASLVRGAPLRYEHHE